MIINRIRVVFLILGVGLLLPAYGAIQLKTLSNGLKVAVDPVKSVNAVALQVWYKVGAIDEPLGETGISHVLEHLMFRGTTDYPQDAFSQALHAQGGSDNAFTSYDYTAYVERIPRSALPLALTLEADRMQHLQFSVQTFQKEKAIVKEERLMRIADNPLSQLFERFNAVANMGSPRSNPIIGWPSDLRQMTYQDVLNWYAKWYQPQNAMIVVVGDVDPKHVFQMVKQDFGRINGFLMPARKAFPGLSNPGKRRVAVALKAEVPAVVMGYKTPSLISLPVDQQWQAYALVVLAHILSGGHSARLDTVLVRQEKVASYVRVHYSPISRLPSQFVVSVIPAKGVGFDTVVSSVRDQIQALKTTKVSRLELEKVKKQLLANTIYAQDSLSGTARRIGRMLTAGLSLQAYEHYLNRIDQVTPKQVQQVAKIYLKSNSETVGILSPVKTQAKAKLVSINGPLYPGALT